MVKLVKIIVLMLALAFYILYCSIKSYVYVMVYHADIDESESPSFSGFWKAYFNFLSIRIMSVGFTGFVTL